jgi:hypothetical protein
MNKNQLKELVEETLTELELNSPEAVNLILGTIAQESKFGYYIKQLNNGPAKGICQMETNTHNDIWNNYLKYKKSIVDKISKFSVFNSADELVWNLKYSIAMCRIHYLRVPKAIPFGLQDQAEYYKKYYNTIYGAATTEEYINNYNKYVK